MSFDVESGAMVCRMQPGRDMNAAMFGNACVLLDKMMRIGMPMTMSCNGAPIMCCTNK